MVNLLWRLTLLLAAAAILLPLEVAQAESPAEIYKQRILPLLKSDQASSCRECHFQGVELKEFMSEDPAATFAQLRARGWIDIDHPEKSKLLSFIDRSSSTTSAVQDKVRQAERLALNAWIVAACRDADLLKIPVPLPNDLKLNQALIQHTRRDHVVDRFITTIWSQLERCANCHSPERNAKQVEKNGEQMSWIVPRSPEATLELLIERKLIDLEQPLNSQIRVKPLAIVEHGAGIKFPEGGATDLAWSDFLQDLSKTRQARYTSTSQLPQFGKLQSWRTGLHMRINDWPADENGKLVTITLHRRRADQSFEPQPSAFAESRIQPGKGWSNSFSIVLTQSQRMQFDVTAPPELDRLMPEGEYEARIWRNSPSEVLSAQRNDRIQSLDRIGQTRLPAPWKPGHANLMTISLTSF